MRRVSLCYSIVEAMVTIGRLCPSRVLLVLLVGLGRSRELVGFIVSSEFILKAKITQTVCS